MNVRAAEIVRAGDLEFFDAAFFPVALFSLGSKWSRFPLLIDSSIEASFARKAIDLWTEFEQPSVDLSRR